jgi:hypothetical protein
MPATDTLSILKRIAIAYPEKRLDKATLQLYQEELADIPISLLDQAVSRHIQVSPWFPHISELRNIAQQIAGNIDFASLSTPGVDSLALEAHQLETAYFKLGEFDPLAWEKLARQLERCGRIYRAEELRLKAIHIQELEAANQRGERYPSPEVRARYAEWVNPK